MTKRAFVGTVAALVFVGDQASKWYVRSNLGLYESIPVIDSCFHITHARNTGAAFSLLADAPYGIRLPFFIIVTILALGALLYFLRQVGDRQRLLQFALAGILGGALGNFVDRIFLGSVTDFFDVHWNQWTWPTFNVADSFISIGMVVLLVQSFFGEEPGKAATPEP